LTTLLNAIKLLLLPSLLLTWFAGVAEAAGGARCATIRSMKKRAWSALAAAVED